MNERATEQSATMDVTLRCFTLRYILARYGVVPYCAVRCGVLRYVTFMTECSQRMGPFNTLIKARKSTRCLSKSRENLANAVNLVYSFI